MDQNPGSETLRNSVHESVLLCMHKVLGRHLASQASPGVGLEPQPLWSTSGRNSTQAAYRAIYSSLNIKVHSHSLNLQKF